MTRLQLEYVLNCAELGSVSKAAKALLTTTSNLSKMLRSLEDELGFEIFRKGPRGLEPTDRGRSFLKHATAITKEYKLIDSLHPNRRSNHFSCVCMQIPHCFEAFERLCRMYQGGESMDFTLSIDYFPSCVDRVARRRCDLGVITMPYLVDEIQREELANRGLKVEHLTRQTLNVNLRRGHPALEGWTPGEPFDFARLQDYPYVSYSNPIDRLDYALDFSQLSYFSVLGAASPKKCIYVDNIDWKAQLVGLTDAYSMGISGPKELADKNNWVCIPLPDYESNMYCIYPRDVSLAAEAKQYLSLLREVLDSTDV